MHEADFYFFKKIMNAWSCPKRQVSDLHFLDILT